MAETTGISWCDATFRPRFNPWVGCTKISPGCKHCYAESLVTGRMGRQGTWGPTGTRERTSASTWAKPHRWNRLAAEGLLPDGSENRDGHRPRVFCASLADVFDPRPEVDPWRRELFEHVIAATTNLDWLILTKRPDYAAGWLSGWYDRSGEAYGHAAGARAEWPPLPNIWLGASIESTRYTWRADWLRVAPAAVRFLSCEPLLGSLFTVPVRAPEDPGVGQAGAESPAAEPPDALAGTDRAMTGTPGGVTVRHSAQGGERPTGAPTQGPPAALAPVEQNGPEAYAPAPLDLTGIDWVIVGGESGGRNARPMHPDWAREIRDAVLLAGAHPALDEAYLLGAPDDVLQEGVAWEVGEPRPALHMKQWGSWAPNEFRPDAYVGYTGRRYGRMELDAATPDPADEPLYLMRYAGASPAAGGKLLDGVDWCEFPDRQLVPA